MVVSCHRVLGIELESSGKAATSLSHLSSSKTFILLFSPFLVWWVFGFVFFFETVVSMALNLDAASSRLSSHNVAITGTCHHRRYLLPPSVVLEVEQRMLGKFPANDLLPRP